MKFGNVVSIFGQMQYEAYRTRNLLGGNFGMYVVSVFILFNDLSSAGRGTTKAKTEGKRDLEDVMWIEMRTRRQ